MTGANGQLGHELISLLDEFGSVMATSRAQLDLADDRALRRFVREFRPQVIVNAAAFTAVDRAESESDAATQINAVAPRVLAEESARLGSILVHFSTDYVFDGRKTSPYLHDDAPNPLNVYGATKLEGERAVLAIGGERLIIRAGWIYATRGRNFMLTIIDHAARGRELRVVNDQRGSPNWARLLAQGTCGIIRALIEQGSATTSTAQRIYHLSCSGETTWHDFAEQILQHASLRDASKLTAVTSEQYNATARRPAYSVLCCDATVERFGVKLCDWREGLRLAWMSGELRDAARDRGLSTAER